MTPACIRIAEPFTFLASLTDVALTIRERGKVGGIYRYVTSKIRVLLSERSGASIEASLKRRTILTQLPGEAVHGPHTRTVSEGVLQARMLCDEARYPRPRGKCKENFDKASADESAGAKAIAPRPTERVQLDDQSCYFGRVEEGANILCEGKKQGK